jgi:protoporphyrinogen oxidase
MPVVDLVAGLSCSVPEKIWKIAQGLRWRNFITVGLLLKKLKIKNNTKIKTINDLIPDVWIYIQERDVKLGRLQVFNNWSPYLVKDPDTVWLGLEYFCDDSDDLWNRDDRQMAQLAVEELAKIDMIDTADVLDQVVIRQAKTYPAYFGTYDQFPELRQYLDQFENLFLIGRNGMHRYNNMDHSMLTAMTAVDAIAHGIRDKESIWAVNAEEDYHEEKK